MGKAFFDQRDKEARLHDTICRWDSAPVYVRAIASRHDNIAPLGPSEILVAPLQGINSQSDPIKAFLVDYTDPRFDYTAPPLGYVNIAKGGAFYLTRIPARRNHAGLHMDCISSVEDREIAYKYANWIASPQMADCILGTHPTIEKAFELLNERKSAAFHRHFSLSRLDRKKLLLNHRGRSVGWSTGTSDKPNFLLFASRDNCPIASALREIGVPFDVERSNSPCSAE